MESRVNMDLIQATRKGDFDAVEKMLEDGASPSFADSSDGNTSLHIAAQKDNVEIIKLLLNYLARADLKNAAGRTPIEEALLKEHWQCIHPMIKSSTAAARGRVLLYAINNLSENLKTLIDDLLKEDLVFTWRFNQSESYCLHVAVLRGDFNLVRRIIDAGSPLDQKNKAGQTPFQLALATESWYCAMEIAKKTKRIHLNLSDYNQLIMKVVSAGSKTEILEETLACHQSVDISWQTKLHCTTHALTQNDIALAKILLSHNMWDANQNAAAIAQSKWKIVNLVAPIEIKNNMQKFSVYVMDLSRKKFDEELINLYCRYAPHGNTVHENNMSILASKNSEEACKWMVEELRSQLERLPKGDNSKKNLEKAIIFYIGKIHSGLTQATQGTTLTSQTTAEEKTAEEEKGEEKKTSNEIPNNILIKLSFIQNNKPVNKKQNQASNFTKRL